jgi:hypothetical protein
MNDLVVARLRVYVTKPEVTPIISYAQSPASCSSISW